MYCCSGCFRPPCGGTLATVPSSIFRRACCTPSPETSRVIGTVWVVLQILYTSSRDVGRDGDVVVGLADLVDLVDVDDAALRALQVEVGGVQELEQDVLDVL